MNYSFSRTKTISLKCDCGAMFDTWIRPDDQEFEVYCGDCQVKLSFIQRGDGSWSDCTQRSDETFVQQRRIWETRLKREQEQRQKHEQRVQNQEYAHLIEANPKLTPERVRQIFKEQSARIIEEDRQRLIAEIKINTPIKTRCGYWIEPFQVTGRTWDGCRHQHTPDRFIAPGKTFNRTAGKSFARSQHDYYGSATWAELY